jgi:hypothetical protein
MQINLRYFWLVKSIVNTDTIVIHVIHTRRDGSRMYISVVLPNVSSKIN